MTPLAGRPPRFLRPATMLLVAGDLWLIDVFQPAAAVADPLTGVVSRIVSWTVLPPAGETEAWLATRVHTDGFAVWVQQHVGGPIMRVDDDSGLMQSVPEDADVSLAHAGMVWCTSGDPGQQIVTGPGPHDEVDEPEPGSLIGFPVTGEQVHVSVPGPVRSLSADPSGSAAVMADVDCPPFALRPMGADSYEVLWSAVTYRIAPPAGTSAEWTAAQQGQVTPPTMWDFDDLRELAAQLPASPWHTPPVADPNAPEMRWAYGWAPWVENGIRSYDERRVLVSLHGPDGVEQQRWELGAGHCKSALKVGDALILAVERPGARPRDDQPPAEVVRLEPGKAARTLLPPDITAACWPPVDRPVSIDAYLAETLTANSNLMTYWQEENGHARPLITGMYDAQTSLIGEWPHTELEWSFRHDKWAGLLLRRRIRLFDELGRPRPLWTSDIGLMEDVETGQVTPASQAVDGILEI